MGPSFPKSPLAGSVSVLFNAVFSPVPGVPSAPAHSFFPSPLSLPCWGSQHIIPELWQLPPKGSFYLCSFSPVQFTRYITTRLLVKNHCFEYFLVFPQLRISAMVHRLPNKIPNSLKLHKGVSPLHAVHLLFIITASIFLFFYLWTLCSCHVKCLSTPVSVHGMNIQGKLGVYINPRDSPWY